MASEYYPFGDILPGLAPSLLMHEESRQLLSACQKNSDFEVLELRRFQIDGEQGQTIVDGIVVESCDGTVPSRNEVGIKNRERLLLLHAPGLVIPHDVRALRIGFPVTNHQNDVPFGEPPSLCLYFEPWSAVERTWTPAKHLQRILWWLRETARGTLHRNDQPLERIYFVTRHKLVLPTDFHEHAANQDEVLKLVCARSRSTGTVLRGGFISRQAATENDNDLEFDSLVVQVPPAIAIGTESHPKSLGELHDRLVSRGSEFLDELVQVLKRAIPGGIGLKLSSHSERHTFLLLQIPVARDTNSEPERTDVVGFVVHKTGLASLAVATGAAFDGKNGQAYATTSFSETADAVAEALAWRNLVIEPIDVRFAFSPQEARKASGVPEEGADTQIVLAGVGALGSCMSELWSRAGWGRLTFIDDDILEAHNLVRHVGGDVHIGWAKVDVVALLAEKTWPHFPKPVAISAKVTALDDAAVREELASAKLLVDATTTLEVPRDLSDRNESPRIATVFFTPSGRDSVLMLEDTSRNIPMYALEAQYYRAILNSDWGGTHLNGHYGTYWVGGGCRDISGVLSQEIVQVHGATLARQVRLLSANPDAQIRIWSLDEKSGAVTGEVVPIAIPKVTTFGEWRVIWDEGVAVKLKEIRKKSLPVETGGVILGYVDQKRKTINIVDVLAAPLDSIAERTGFTRGVTGVREAIERAASLTANIVGYLGEWHSHPEHMSAAPSSDDAVLINYLADMLAVDGVPALMVIVGELDISVALKEVTSA